MDTNRLKRFAQDARRELRNFVAARLPLVLAENSAARRERPQTVSELEKARKSKGDEALIDQIAYTWFNRFCALRFMDVMGYNPIRIVSPLPSHFQPEILEEAKGGNIDETFVADSKIRERVKGLLAGSIPAVDGQGEAYKLLLVSACNAYNKVMPFLFQKIDDYTELLMPDELMKEKSILMKTREAITEDVAADGVEVIGWLYQFYISEKKDEVMGKTVKTEDIPAATQLFTPDWIVRYLVQNSLGRLWMLNHPNSKLAEEMEYYIPVGSDEWVVYSEEWVVVSGKYVRSEEVAKYVRKELSRVAGLAEEHGFGNAHISTDNAFAEGRNICSGKSNAESGGVNSIQYCRGTSKKLYEGIRELSVNSEGIKIGVGNPTYDLCSPEILDAISNRSGVELVRRGWQDAERIDWQALHALVVNVGEQPNTTHYSLPTTHLKISSPEEIRICDPCCGSGHMLTYAFDLLVKIYEEEGYDRRKIPTLILLKNLHGVEIDTRAGELAAFALTMKAREYDSRFLRRENAPHPRICVLENFSEEWSVISGQFEEACKQVECKLDDFLHDINLFKQADCMGSLLMPKLPHEKISDLIEYFSNHHPLTTDHSLFEDAESNNLQKVLSQADFLSQKYHVVVTNPPYMGGKGMNADLKSFAERLYPDSKSDLFAMFIERCLQLVRYQGTIGMITMQSWMFLSSFEKLRTKLLDENTILSMAHLGARGFDSIGGEVVQTTAFTMTNTLIPDYKGAFIRLVDGNNESEKAAMFRESVR